MHFTPSFTFSPLARVLKIATLGPLFFVTPNALALTIVQDGAATTIAASTPVDNYLLRRNASLTASGATTQQINATTGSSVNLSGTTVTAQGVNNGVDLSASHAIIANQSKISSERTGLALAQTTAGGSSAVVRDSEISGAFTGVSVSRDSQLTLQNATINGTNANAAGISSFGGTVSVTGGTITGGLDGVQLFGGNQLPATNSFALDAAKVVGLSGAAIVVDGLDQANSEQVNIDVNNGSTLIGDNGNLLEVTGGSAANFRVDNSDLVGDIVVADGSSADVLLNNSATLIGRLENVQNLAVNNAARWVMVGDGSVENLTLNGGGVQFGNPGEYFKLSVGTLSGEGGTFYMNNNFGTGQIDTLNVTETASGNHNIVLDSSGSEPVAAGSTAVVHIAAGDAQFSLVNGPVEQGAFSYDLIKVGNNDWYLNTASRVISPGTQSVVALFNAAPTVWYGELSTLRSRMGEVRMDHGKAGGWMRAYGNKYDVSASSGVAYRQTQQGLSFGADAPLPFGDGQWLIGVLGGYSQSDLDMDRGTTGEVDSYYFGAYTTWLDDSGYYFDGVLKFNRFQNESSVQLSDGKKTKGEYDNNGVGASLEFGRHVKLADDYFVEPFTQLSGVIIESADYDLDNGLAADGDRTRSVLGKVGATVGRNFTLSEGKVVQPYLRAAYVHEFAKNNDIEVNDNRFNADLSGSRGELGAGVAMAVADQVSIHADFDYSNGDKIEQPWGANVGVRYSW